MTMPVRPGVPGSPAASANQLHSSGLLVLGMHRSGTSALSHMLSLAGADPGERVLGASRGNESGHWEDGFAVDLNDQLLASFGARWDDPFALPPGWRQHAAAQVARGRIARYLDGNRRGHAVWSVKDPRLSLLGGLWIEAAASVELPVAAVMLLRHPREVAESLAVRDGIGHGTALLLWLEYTLSAVAVAESLPSIVVEFGDLVANWRTAADRIRSIPTAGGLDFEGAAEEIDRSLRPALHHHAHDDDAGLPLPVVEVWQRLRTLSRAPGIPAGTAAALAEPLAAVIDLLGPFAEEQRLLRQRLWDRVARAESQLAPAIELMQRMPDEFAELRERMDRHQAGVVGAYSSDVRNMQQAHAAAINAAAQAQGEAAASQRFAQQQQLIAEQQRVRAEDASQARLAAENALAVARQEAEQARLDAEKALAVARQEAEQARLDAENALAVARQEAEQERRAASEARLDAEKALAAERGAKSEIQQALSAANQALAEATHTIAGMRDALAEARREAVVMRAGLERGREAAAWLELVLHSRSWRLTRPIRVLGRLMRGEWAQSDARNLRVGMRKLFVRLPLLPQRVKHAHVRDSLLAESQPAPVTPTEAAAVGLVPAPSSAQLPDVFVWAVIDWHFRTQRPQHLSRALADKGHRVFYVSNNFVDDPQPGFALLPLDGTGRLFQVHLHVAGAPQIYADMPDGAQLHMLRASLAEVLRWSGTTTSISIVQHPYWAQLSTMVPSARLVYDCMDHHAGFENNASAVLRAERQLVAEADVVAVTSDGLAREVAPQARQVAVVRNGGDFAFFSRRPAEVFQDPRKRKVIGYYGAIAEWFDVDLVRAVARRFPDALVVLVGADTAGVAAALGGLENIHFQGEVAYDALPYWLYAFDVCLLPFKVVPLTLATNPVKVYEYLAAGKPVVAVDLPEMQQFDGLVQVAADAGAFVEAVDRVLSEPESAADADARQAFARTQTWELRATQLDAVLRNLSEPRVSVVVLAYNNLALTKACLESIERHSDYRNVEVIVVDNLSIDGSREWLARWAEESSPAGHDRRLVLNDRNAGFAAGNNIGLRLATGNYIVILNNDTEVTHGWVRTLCWHLRRDPRLGLVGPITDNIGNEARVDIAWDGGAGIEAVNAYTRSRPGEELPLRTAAFFCVAMPRAVYEAVGPLDESYGLGFFEDDDYCRRVEQAGFRVACAEDVFVHHHLSASFNQVDSEERRLLFERNRQIYEAKWGTWLPHSYRPGENAQ
jgi:GT2 family glycosyltransferase